MLKRRRTSISSFSADGRRAGGIPPPSCPPLYKTKALITNGHSNNTLFTNKTNLQVVRAPIMNGLTCGGGMSAKVLQPFRRPKEERRSKQQHNDEALKKCTLGMARRMDGMQKILSRSGRGLHFKPPPTTTHEQKKLDEDGNTCSESSSEEEDEDRPFDPLRVWTSPHNGAEPIGLPTRV
jgi:hypothetical protein